jgi:HAD superfamily hydrolase (TIGR01509 family)
VIFDCDGLLVDSSACWHEAYAAVCRASGARLEDLDLSALNGASVAGAASYLSTALAAEVDEQTLRAALGASVANRRPPALPGAQALVNALSGRVPLAVASNGPSPVVWELLVQNQLADAFTAIVSADQVAAPKPAPDVYLKAVDRLGVDGSDAVALEDSQLGVEAARAAGILVVGVPSVRGQRLDADLVAARLDDSRLLDLLGLAELPESVAGRWRPGPVDDGSSKAEEGSRS